MTDVRRVALAARIFAVAALTSLAAVAGTAYLQGAAVVIATAIGALLLSWTTQLSETAVATLEGAAVAALAVASFPEQATVTPYLVIPVLIGAMDRGRRGVLLVLAAELSVLVVLWTLVVGRWDRELAASGVTWLATSIGLAFLGTSLRRAAAGSETEESYRSAVGLIRRLQALSGKLSSGLDPVDIAEQVMDETEELVPTRHAGVFVRNGDGAVPLRFAVGTSPGSMSWATSMADKCWADGDVVLHERQAALPLSVDDEIVAVLVLDGLRMIDQRTAAALGEQLAPHALQLQAALLFGRVRDTATSQERQRIAREVHDGVAQDVASLGYLVDNLATASDDPAQQERIAQLRGEVTRVVTELRHSIFDLRQVIPAGAGLGESLSAYARQVGSTSPMTIHVTLDEKGQRLRPDVEHELLRIAQEAMHNARKHSGAENLWLSCTVRAPEAEIEVRDDGRKTHSPASDSQGLKIMRERAESIGAELEVHPPNGDGTGTRVHVRLGAGNV